MRRVGCVSCLRLYFWDKPTRTNGRDLWEHVHFHINVGRKWVEESVALKHKPHYVVCLGLLDVGRRGETDQFDHVLDLLGFDV